MILTVDGCDGSINGHKLQNAVRDVGYQLCIYLDGVKQDHVFRVDTDEGAVTVYRTGPDGDFVVEGDEYEVLHGHVSVRIEPMEQDTVTAAEMAANILKR